MKENVMNTKYIFALTFVAIMAICIEPSKSECPSGYELFLSVPGSMCDTMAKQQTQRYENSYSFTCVDRKDGKKDLCRIENRSPGPKGK